MRAVPAWLCAVIGGLTLLSGCGGGGGSGSTGGDGSGSGNNPPPAPTLSLTLQSSAATVLQGSSVTLTWSSTAADSCSASGGWSGTRPTSGSETLSNLQSTATYYLRCSNSTGSVDQSVAVQVALPPPPTISLSVTPELADRGSTVTISWTTANASSCTREWSGHGDVPLEGSMPYAVSANHPTAQFVLTMSCWGPGGENRQTLIVPVRTFAGQLLIPAGVFADGDVNDPASDYTSNDEQPQSVLPFALIPGYVNVAGQGPQGRSFASGDQWDYYLVDSDAANQVIRLILPTVDMSRPAAERDDADLYLYDWTYGTLLDASISANREEVLQLPSQEQFVIGVKAERGGFNYLLSIEDAPLVTSLSSTRLSSEFIPGEAIVTLKAGAASSLDGAGRKGRAQLRSKAGAAGREMLVEFSTEPAAAPGSRQKSTRAFGQKAEARMSEDTRRKLATLQEIKRLSQQAEVRSATANRIVHAQLTPTDPLYARQRWHYESIQLPAAWDVTTGSSDVIVAVVDSGAVMDHPELQSKLVDGYDVVDGDADVSDPGYESGVHTIYHGTHVMGTIGGAANNAEGGSGVAWGARIMPVRVLDGRSGSLYDVLQGVRYAAGLPNDSGRVPARRAHIINLSLGANESCAAEEAELYSQISASGIVVVASAGNSRSNVETAPASCPSVFGVIATGAGGTLAQYSNYGSHFALAAPGGDTRYDADADGFLDGIFSTGGVRQDGRIVPGYATLEGTSMASPHVAGVFALMKSVRPSLTPVELRQLLEGGWLTDADPGDAQRTLGHGIINAQKAVRAADNNMTPPARVGSTPGLLVLDRPRPSAAFTLRNSGVGALSVSSVTGSAPWLTVAAQNVTTDGLGQYLATVNLSGLPRGTHNVSLQVQSSAGPITIPVVVNNVNTGVGSSLSKVYLRVSDASSGGVVTTRPRPFSYSPSYRFDDLPSGTYVVTAGTDMNNDGNLCDPGEVCGAYPVRGVPEAIEYTGVRQAVDIELAVTGVLGR